MQTTNNKTIIARYEINAECLTPVCVKSGQMVMPWEYAFIKENGQSVYCRFNFYDLYQNLGDAKKEELGKKINDKDLLMTRFLINETAKDNPALVKKIAAYSIVADKGFYNTYQAKINERVQGKECNKLEVAEHIRHSGTAFIPGSSIKGALRTILLAREIQNGRQNFVDTLEDKNAPAKKDDFKNLLVFDADIPDEYMGVGIFNRAAPAAMEYIQAGAEFNFAVNIKQNAGFLTNIDFSPKNITGAANEFTKRKVEKFLQEIEEIKKILGDTKTDIDKKNQISALSEILNTVLAEAQNNSGGFVLNLGFGGGFWYKSFFGKKLVRQKKRDTKKDDSLTNRAAHLNIDIPYSWWHNSENVVMGFVKCRFEN